jgi:hypothetical protein
MAPRAVRQQNEVMGPVGLGTKKHCTDKEQQQFNRLRQHGYTGVETRVQEKAMP